MFDDGSSIKIPKGFITDGASIPRFFWRSIGHPFQSRLVMPALIHDFCYRYKPFAKKYADELFFEMLKKNKVSNWRRYLMFWAVKYFGKSSWDAAIPK